MMSDCMLLLGDDLDLTTGPYSTLVGSSFGGWEAITSTTSSLFLDGAVVSGDASSNRQITLLVTVKADDRYSLVEACERLVVEANKASNTLTFTAPGGPAVVYEVFRVQRPERVDDESEAWDERTYELVFPALPFARSAVRETTGALAPAITVAGFESTFTGALLKSTYTSSPVTWAIPAPAAAPLVVSTRTTTSTMTAVSNATLTAATDSLGSPMLYVKAAASGDVEIRTASSWATTADVVTAGIKASCDTATHDAPLVVGVEWLDAADATVRIDWGTPRRVMSNDPSKPFDVWATAPRPSAATKVRVRVRAIGVTNLVAPYQFRWFVAVPAALGTVTPAAGAAHDGATGIDMTMGTSSATEPPNQGAGYLYRALAAPMDLSSVAGFGFWVKPRWNQAILTGATDDAVSLRLFDTSGRWSRYWFRPGTLPAGGWANLYARFDDAYQTSDAGPVDPANVAAFDIDVRQDVSPGFHLDSLTASDAVSATTSPRGTVYELAPVLGSARTTAQVEISSASNLTDWLLAAVPADNGAPMLSVINGLAAASAPAQYDGVYSIIGGLPSGATALGTSCTITQKINGTAVATKTLTGTTRTGGHYVDYGAVALPLVPVPADNQGVSLEFAFAAGSTGEVLVIDVDASLAWVDNLSTAMPCAWVDEPDIVAGLGRVWVGTQPDRTDARGLVTPPTLSRPLQVKAPSTRLLVYSTTTAPNVELSYYPRWLIEPTA